MFNRGQEYMSLASAQVVDDGVFEKDLSKLSEDEKEKYLDLKERNQRLNDKLAELSSSDPSFSRVYRKKWRAYKELEEFVGRLDARHPDWRSEKDL